LPEGKSARRRVDRKPGGHAGVLGWHRCGWLGRPLQVTHSDNRLRQSSAGYSDYADYLGGSISPGQDVLVGEGGFLITLVWSQPVTLEGIKWLPEWQSGSTAQFTHLEADRSVPGVAVTLKVRSSDSTHQSPISMCPWPPTDSDRE
jgi:hypothetical protein